MKHIRKPGKHRKSWFVNFSSYSHYYLQHFSKRYMYLSLKALIKIINVNVVMKLKWDADFEGIFVEINLRKKKWLLCCSYNPHKSNIANHLKRICKTWNKLNSTYDNLVLLRDFNTIPEEESISEFLNLCNLKNLVKQNTCFRNLDKPTCIDLILTNYPRSFRNTDTFETGLSDFH